MATSDATKIVDGSLLEGGGQMLRTTGALACILKQPIAITRIRANRAPKSGLAAQHAAGIRLVSKLVPSMLVSGCIIGSSEVSFTMNQHELISSSSISEDCGTAGAISLMIQISWLVAVFSGHSFVTLNLSGGTNVMASPPIDHTQNVLFPILRQMGVDTSLSITKRGFYPAGGGNVELTISGAQRPLSPLMLFMQGSIQSVHGIIVGNASIELLESISRNLRKELRKRFISIDENISSLLHDFEICHHGSFVSEHRDKKSRKPPKSRALSISIQVWITTSTGCILSANSLSDKGEDDSEIVAQDLFELVVSGATVDEHTADQLLLPMALALGESKLLVGPPTRHSSLHIDSVIYIINTIFNSDIFECVPQVNGCRLITAKGIAFSR